MSHSSNFLVPASDLAPTALRGPGPSAPLRLTPSQIGLLFESRLAGKPGLNQLQVVVHLAAGPVSTPALRAAWDHVTAHHAALRLSLSPLAETGPVQTPVAALVPDFAEIPLPGRDSPEAEIRAWIAADQADPPDPTRWPAWRVRLLRPARGAPVMVWSFHHALLDGGGYRLILQELLDSYAALRDGRAPPLLRSAGDGFLAHCARIETMDHAAGRRFFQAHLAGFDSPSALPGVLAPPPGAAPPTGMRRDVIPGGLEEACAQALRARLAAVGATMADAAALAWGLVLARICGRGEAVFGLTRSGRHLLPSGQASAGCQINTLPCRVRLGPDSLETALRAQRAFSNALRTVEHTPLSEIADLCDAPRDRPLFDTILMFERRSLAQVFDPRLKVEEISRMAPLVTLAVSDDPAPVFRLEYDPERLGEQGAARLLGWFSRLMRAMADPADRPLAALSMLSPQEMAELARFSGPAPKAPDTDAPPLISRIEAAARQHAARPAVVVAGEAEGLSHAALHGRANHLAACLRAEGIGRGDLVALALPRSPEHVIALLAVMKAGAAFVALDIALPDAALSDMLARSGAKAVMGREDLRRRFVAELPLFDPAAPGLAGSADSPPPRPAPAPDDLAYVIFTSGTTGQPKGVMIPERAIAAHAEIIRAAFGLTEADRVLQFAGLGFDVALEEILPSLMSGAALVLRDDDMTASSGDFLAALARERVSVANLPTAFWHVLAADLPPADAEAAPPLPGSLRLMIVGGERVSPTAIARWRRHYPDLRWLNGYGPTETTITATLGGPQVGSGPGQGAVSIIGRPLAHAHCEIRLADDSLAPPGIAGELRIGGPCLGLGYLGRPDLTAAAFRGEGAARAYCSGDLASWQADGQLAYLGRIDRQIKLRGFRIEPAQIEARLEADPAVGGAHVALEGSGAAARLLAWVALGDAADPGAVVAALGARLREGLPAHMVPLILPVRAFARTPGGKIDVAALPRPVAAPMSSPLPEPPVGADDDPAIARIQEIFQVLLGVGPVGPDQSFFDLGGNSLMSVRLMGRLQRAFGLHPALAALYRAPTPRGIAAELARGARGDLPDCMIPIQPAGARPPLYAIHILGEGGAFFRPLARRLGRDQPLIGLTLDLLAPGAPTGVEEIAAIYRANIERHRPEGPVSLIAVSQGAWLAFEIARQLTAQGREVAGLYLLDAAGPGGRPRAAPGHSLAYYLSRLRRNFRNVVCGAGSRLSAQLGFHFARQWVRLTRRLGILSPISTSMAHQAAIDLAISRYVPGVWEGWITLFRATAESTDTEEGIAGALGWRVVTSAGAEVLDVAGDHLTILHEPNVADLAGKLSRLLQREPPLS
ncbi:non-ribosomal peptide synthetase [Pseudogemmobacter sonorensis]|uniref:non-ribosomal peptide synthetase n=1 Tax=Pseudogemmobacter sonorensis TaxID=2989681 RepID=UPI0036CFA6A3